jgi:hypothetical protein
MAQNYQQFSVAINGLTVEEREWLKKLDKAAYASPECLVDPDEDPKDGVALEWATFYAGTDAEFVEIVKSNVYDDFGDKAYWGQSRIGESDWHLYEEESCDLEIVAELIHQFLKRWRPTDTVELSWAETCSKMRVGQFGGGACLITADWVYWPPQDLWVMAKFYTAAKKSGRSMSAEEALAAIEERVEP